MQTVQKRILPKMLWKALKDFKHGPLYFQNFNQGKESAKQIQFDFMNFLLCKPKAPAEESSQTLSLCLNQDMALLPFYFEPSAHSRHLIYLCWRKGKNKEIKMEGREGEMEKGRKEERQGKKEMKKSEEESHVQIPLRSFQNRHIIYIHLNTKWSNERKEGWNTSIAQLYKVGNW